MKEYTFDDVLPGLEPLISKAVAAVDFNSMIAVDQAGRIVQIPQGIMQNDKGEAWLIAEDFNQGHPLRDKLVMDILFYPMPDIDYQVKYGKTVQELNTELVTHIGADVMRPLIDAGQIHAMARGIVLNGERPATYIRVFRAQDYPCSEHPETLLGQPIGMYHCPACGEMQMAGCFHLPREFDDEGNSISVED